MYPMIRLLFLGTLLFMTSCKVKEGTSEPLEYQGPLREADDVDMLHSENDRVRIKLKAKKIIEFKNGDREFPEGLYLEFYDPQGKLTSSLKANNAYYFKKENQWRGRGKVEVKNMEKHQQLNTEELFWNPATKKIFTEKFVTINMQTEVIYGTGLDALQDLSTYTIKKPEGDFEIKD